MTYRLINRLRRSGRKFYIDLRLVKCGGRDDGETGLDGNTERF